MVTKFRTFSYKSCLRLSFPEKCQLTLTMGNRRWEDHWFGDWVTREEEDARAYDKLEIPSRKLSWARDKFFGQRKKHLHGWHTHARCKRLTTQQPQPRDMSRQYRPFGMKACKEVGWHFTLAEAASGSRSRFEASMEDS